MPYSEVSITGYNANPPADDGTAVATNEVQWSKHKEKLGDPIKTALETTQTNITSVIDTIETDVATLQLLIPSGTVMLFSQTTPPASWTKITTTDNAGLRLTSGTVGSGGTANFTTAFAARTITQANLPVVNLSHSLTAASHTHDQGTLVNSSDSHSHTWSDTSSSDTHNHSINAAREAGDTTNNQGGQGTAQNATLSTGNDTHNHSVSGTTSSDSHTHTITGSTGSSGALTVSGTVPLGGSGTAMDFAIKYVDVILATKN